MELKESINESNKCLAELSKSITAATTMFASSMEKMANVLTVQPNTQFANPLYYGSHQQSTVPPYTQPWGGSQNGLYDNGEERGNQNSSHTSTSSSYFE